MSVKANLQKGASAAIKSSIARAPLYRKRAVAPGKGKMLRFFREMEHFSKVLGLASEVRENPDVKDSVCSYAIGLKREYGLDLLSGGREPAVEMANASEHGSLLAGMAMRSDVLLFAKNEKSRLPAHDRKVGRLCVAVEIVLGTLAAAACTVLGYEIWQAIASSGGPKYAILAYAVSPPIALLAFGLLGTLFSKFEEKAIEAACRGGIGGFGLRAAADAWEQVERLALAGPKQADAR
ncbi:MAG: hypothetical protein WC588_05580 [Candidatus Micrarchaeia archaeon]